MLVFFTGHGFYLRWFVCQILFGEVCTWFGWTRRTDLVVREVIYYAGISVKYLSNMTVQGKTNASGWTMSFHGIQGKLRVKGWDISWLWRKKQADHFNKCVWVFGGTVKCVNIDNAWNCEMAKAFYGNLGWCDRCIAWWKVFASPMYFA